MEAFLTLGCAFLMISIHFLQPDHFPYTHGEKISFGVGNRTPKFPRMFFFLKMELFFLEVIWFLPEKI